MKKLSISLLLFLIMILSVSVAFAADDDSSDLALTENVDDSTSIEVESVSEDVAQTSDNSVALQANIVEEKLEQTSGEVLADPVDSSKNFTELQKDIDTASYGFLTLNTNYVRAEGENDIVISKNFNIQGNDIYKIDANNLGGIFKINQGCAVTLMNVVLVNGNSNNGGTIYNEGTVNVISSQISDSTAVCGGAIYNKGVLIISGSTLDGNKATTLGGAVYSVNSTVVDGSNFINNEITTGSSYAPGTNSNGGAAIFSGEDSSLSVESSTFTQNTGDWAYNSFTSGGAIYAYDVDSISIKNNKFNENSAAYGGAIMLEKYTQGTLAIINCEFNNNKGWQGGAINLNEFVNSISITGSNFTSNEATTPNAGDASPMGGAIVMGTQSTDGVSLSVDACNFNNNNGGYMGGAICSFANNDIKVTNSNFTGNEAEHYGGAITTGTGSSLTVDGCDFTNNAAPDFGAAILCEPNSQSKIVNSNFTGNVDNKGSAVTTIQGTLYLSKNKFNDAGIYNNGGVVTSNVTAVVLENGTLEVYDDTVTLTAIVTDDNGNPMRDNSFKFLINGKEVEATYSEIDGYYKGTYILPGAGIYTVGITSNKDENLTTKNGTVKNYKGTFTDLYGKVNDAISGGYDLDLEYNFTFVEGLDSDYIKNNGILLYSLNINGNGHTIDGASLSTGFSVLKGTCSFKNVTFTNLKTAIYGEAVYSPTININLDDCIFKDNQNSAIYAYDGELNAVNCIFVNNTGTYGGAIKTFAYEDTVIDNCTFENNSADYGGAIYAMYSDVTITESRFINNNASYKGGAIDTEQNTISISDSVLDGNDIINLETSISQNWGGAAIYADQTTVTLTNTNVTNNGRSNLDRTNGDMINAVVHLINSSATITGGLFENNTGIYGGAINAESGTTNTITVTGATFNNNKAYNGAAINLHNMETTISDCNFTNNWVIGPGSSGYYGLGGAIAVDGAGSFNLSGSNFTNNRATGVGANGGAIWAGSNDENFDVSIDDCTFKQNTAVLEGGAVYVYTYVASISNSTFSDDNEAEIGNAIYNGYNLKLSNNSIDGDSSEIYSSGSGKIDTHVWVIVNDNQDVSVEYYDTIPVVVKITDDSGNLIRINATTLQIDLGDSWTRQTLTLDEDTGFYTMDAFLVDQRSGKLTPSRLTLQEYFKSYDANYNLNSSYVTMTKANASFEILYDNVTYPGDVVITVNLTGKAGAPKINWPATSSTAFTVIVDDVPHKVKITNGIGTVTIPDLSVGNYVINASWGGNTKYNAIKPQLYDLAVYLNGTYTDLQNRINLAIAAGVDLVLPYNFTFNASYDGANFPNGIIVSDNLTIIGNGYTICGNDSNRVFNVTAGTLTLNNLTICHGAASEGAGVYVSAGSALNADNVTFVYNTADSRGGAIYSEGDVTINHSVFDSNDILKTNRVANTGGAAIYNNGGTLNINDTNITNNLKDIIVRNDTVGDLVSAVVVSSGETLINNSYFANNTGCYGGAVLFEDTDKNLTVINTVFEGNNATFGGAIYALANIEVDNCAFDDNHAVGHGSGSNNAVGGAISVTTSASGPNVVSVSIKNSNFTGNNATVGGAIDLNKVAGDMLIDGCKFENNNASASASAGAIDLYICGGKAVISNSNFTANRATGFNGGAIFATNTNLDVIGGVFENNNATSGGAIYLAYGDLKVIGSNFTGNNAVTEGGAIYHKEGTLNVTSSRFVSNKKTKIGNTGGGAAIYSIGISTVIDHSKFINNWNLGGNNGAVYYLSADDGILNVTNSEFSGNEISGSSKNGKAINIGRGDLYLDNNTINTDSADVYVANSARMISYLNLTVMENSTYDVNSKSIRITVNVVDDNGNRVYLPAGTMGQVKFNVIGYDTNKVLKRNATTGLYWNDYTLPNDFVSVYHIGATYTKDTGKVESFNATVRYIKGTYTDLQAQINAAVDAGVDLTLPYNFTYTPEIDGDNFPDGIILDKGLTINGDGYTISGAKTVRIFKVESATVTLNDIKFVNGTAISGGAIYTSGELTINGCEFINNTATTGDAIFISAVTPVSIIGGEEGYNDLLDDQYSALNRYYAEYPNEDVDVNDPRGHSWNAAISSPTDPANTPTFPWVVLDLPNFFGKITVKYDGQVIDAVSGVYLTIGYSGYFIWSVPDDLGLTKYRLNPDGSVPVDEEGNEIIFDPSKLEIIIDPAFTDPDNLAFIVDEASYDALLNDPDSALNEYYALYPDEDVDVNDPRGHSWTAAISANAANVPDGKTRFPWIVANLDNYTGYIVVTYNNVHKFNWKVTNKEFAIISVPGSDDCNMVEYALDKGTGHADKILDTSLFEVLYYGKSNSQSTVPYTISPVDIVDSSVLIKDSIFKNNGGANDFAVYNDEATLALDGNTIDNIIYNSGTITTMVNATLNNNQTIAGKFVIGDEVTINATLTDKEGNAIYDPSFRISADGAEIKDIEYDVATRLYTSNYTISHAGDTIVSTLYDNNNINILIGIYTIPKANATITVTTGQDNKFKPGENITIFVGLYDNHTGIGLNVTGLVVIVNNTRFTVDITNGTGSFNVTGGLEPGQYAALATFDGDDNYNGPIYDTAVFDVLYPDRILSIVAQDTMYPDVAIVNITITDAKGNKINGIVVLNINGTEYTVNVDGNKSYEISGLAVGKYLINATLLEDAMNTEVINDTVSFTVLNNTNVTFKVTANDTIFYGSNLTVEIGTVQTLDGLYNVTGNATIYIFSGDELVKVIPGIEVTEQGATVNNISGLSAGSYSIAVEFDSSDNYYHGDATAQTTVSMSNAIINVTPSISKYGENVTVTVDVTGLNGELLNGTIAYVVSGHEDIHGFIYVVNGTGSGNITALLDVGEYTIFSSFIDSNGNYYGSSYDQFEVTQADANVTANSTQDTYAYGSDVVINVTLTDKDGNKLNGTVAVTVDNVTYSVAVNNGVESLTIKGLSNGTYTVTAIFTGSKNYAKANAEDSQFVINATTEVVLEVTAADEITYNETLNVTVKITDGAGVAIANTPFTYTIDGGDAIGATTGEDGSVVIPIDNLAAGKHNVTVNFNDGVHAAVSKTINVTVNPAGSSVVIDPIADVVYNATVEVTYTVENATDVIVVVKDAAGTVITDGVNTTVAGKVVISGLNAGEYTITIASVVDDNHTEFTANATFNVLKATITIEPNATGDFVVDGVINVTFILPADVNASSVSATIDGFPVIPSSKDGVNWTITFDNLAAGLHIVAVSVINDPNYNDATGNVTFIVNKVDPEIIIDDIAAVVGETVEVNVTIVGGDATGYIFFDGKGYIVKDGKVTIPLVIKEAGIQNINVTYTGDDKYYNGTGVKAFNAGKAASTIYIIGTENITTVDIAVVSAFVGPEGVTGYVNFTLDGVAYGEPVELNSLLDAATILISNLAAGVHNVTAQYTGDTNYNASDIVKFTIVVNKTDVNMTIEGSTITYGENATVTVTGLPEDAIGNVTVTINGNNYTGDVEFGSAVIEIPDLGAGIYEGFAVVYSGDDKYNDAVGMATINVNKAGSSVVIDPITDVTYPGDVVVNFTVTNETVVSVVVTSANGTEITEGITLANGNVTITGLSAGKYTINITNAEGDNYTSSSATAQFEVAKATPVISVSAVNATYPDGVVVTVISSAAGNVTVKLGDKSETVTVKADTPVNVTISDLAAGDYVVNVTIAESANYTVAFNDSVKANVAKAGSNVTVPYTEGVIETNIIVTLTNLENATGVVAVVFDANNNPVGNVYYNGNEILVTGLPEGIYTINVTTVVDENHTETSASGIINVTKIKDYNMTVNSTSPSQGRNATVTVVVPIDATGNVTVILPNGTNYTAPVKNGVATVDVPGLLAGETEVNVTYSGDGRYDSKTANTTITVKPKLKTVLSGKTLTMYYGDGSKLAVTLLDENGDPVVGRKVKFTVLSKTYTPKTDSNGVAYLTIRLKPSQVTATIAFDGDSEYEAADSIKVQINVLSKVRIDKNTDLVKDYYDYQKFKVRALDQYGKHVGAGETVKMTVNGKTYSVKTDKYGYACMDFKLTPGTYTVKSTYAGYSVTNKLTVKNVIHASDASYKKASSYKYTVTLKYSSGKPIYYKVVATINGKSYSKNTDSNGVAPIVINQALSAGKYSIVVKYRSSQVTKKITIL